MTVKFQSQATADLVMLGKHAHEVLKLIGKSEQGSGILETKDMPAALLVLKALPQEAHQSGQQVAHAQAGDAAPDDDDQDHMPEAPEPAFIDESISLRKRAWPLVMMIERAMKEDKPIVWNVTL